MVFKQENELMTEKEKILCGEFYDTRDSGLRCLSNHAKDLMRVYNSLINMNATLYITKKKF
jgi:hypothetical protein